MVGRLVHTLTFALLLAMTLLAACREGTQDEEPEVDFRDGTFTLTADADTYVTEREPTLNFGTEASGLILSDVFQYHGLIPLTTRAFATRWARTTSTTPRCASISAAIR